VEVGELAGGASSFYKSLTEKGVILKLAKQEL
jgi:hypothetical protein